MIALGSTPHRFHFEKDRKDRLLTREIDWTDNPIGLVTVYRTYLRKKNDGFLESWNEAVIRVVEGMFTILKTHIFRSGLIWEEEKAQRQAEEAANRIFEFKWTPPGRGLWMMGTDFMWEKGGAALNNCAFVSTEKIEEEGSEPFRFLMDMSMLGVGVGFDTEGANKIEVKGPSEEQEHFLIPDSREGWVESIGKLIDSYFFGFPQVKIDTRKIRPYGATIRGFGGVASGPDPLVQGFNGIKDILDNRVGARLTSTDIVDIQNIIGKIVVAGNVRRTAEIAFGSVNDSEFREMKSWSKYPVSVGSRAPEELKDESKQDYDTYNASIMTAGDNSHKEIAQKYNDRPWAYKFGGWRWASNNSVFGIVGMDYSSIAEQIYENGEPGIAWLDNMQNFSRMIDPPDYKDYRAKGGNPCNEQTLEPYELCCLVETYPSNHNNAKDFFETLKIAYLYAKAVTLMATHNPKTNTVMCRNRRIGCSQSGIIEAVFKFGRHYYQKNMCDKAYKEITRLDHVYSEWLGIPESIKRSSVKPSGSVSLLAGVSPGIHYPKIQFGYRTMRLAVTSPIVEILKTANYRIEPSVTDPHRTVVVYFPVVGDDKVPSEKDSNIWEYFTNVVMMQKYWSDNQVSVTIPFKAEEKEQIAKCLSTFDNELKSVSLLPLIEHGYTQAPYIEEDKEVVMEYKNSLKPLDLSSLNTEGEGAEDNKFCDGESCVI